ncbi:hypothetical protein JXA88_00940 [Candidatus Fermentibacteria bacterium]|nr:hypothetical protein [Candidatus Fermentibacteria bacterium]
MGCQVTLHVDRDANRVARVTGREIPPNDGMLIRHRQGRQPARRDHTAGLGDRPVAIRVEKVADGQAATPEFVRQARP